MVFSRLIEIIDGDTPEAPGFVNKLAWMASMFWLGTMQTLVDSAREKEMRVYGEEPDIKTTNAENTWRLVKHKGIPWRIFEVPRHDS